MPDTPDDNDPEGYVVGDSDSPAGPTAEYRQWVERLSQVLEQRVRESVPVGEETNYKYLRRVDRRDLRLLAGEVCDAEWPLLNRVERERLIDDALDEVIGFGPLEALLKDPTISDILVNGPGRVFVERRGKLERTEVWFRDRNHLRAITDRILSGVGRRIDETTPYIDVRLPDGSRVNVVIPPLSLDGPCLSIRRFGANPLKLEDLLNYKAFTPEMAMLMEACIKARLNILVSGGTGSGKTTVLNTLSSFIPDDERVVTIEEVAELQLQHDHVVRLEVVVQGQTTGRPLGLGDLLQRALRLRPDRIVIGETRGPDSLELLLAMSTGRNGWLNTIHANTPRDAVERLETIIQMAAPGMPRASIHRQLAAAVTLIIQISRLQGGPRKITSVAEVIGTGDTFELRELFRFKQLGVDQNGRAYGQFEATGLRPTFIDLLETRGIRLPSPLFAERVLMRD